MKQINVPSSHQGTVYNKKRSSLFNIQHFPWVLLFNNFCFNTLWYSPSLGINIVSVTNLLIRPFVYPYSTAYISESVFQLDIETSFSNFIHLLLSKWVITYSINVCELYVCVCVCAYFVWYYQALYCEYKGEIIWNTKWKGVKKGFNWYV